MYLILSWASTDKCDTQVVLGKDTLPLMFHTYGEAEEFAKKNMAFEWQIVEIPK